MWSYESCPEYTVLRNRHAFLNVVLSVLIAFPILFYKVNPYVEKRGPAHMTLFFIVFVSNFKMNELL